MVNYKMVEGLLSRGPTPSSLSRLKVNKHFHHRTFTAYTNDATFTIQSKCNQESPRSMYQISYKHNHADWKTYSNHINLLIHKINERKAKVPDFQIKQITKDYIS